MAALAMSFCQFSSLAASAGDVSPDLLRAETIVTGKEEPERTRGFKECVTQIVVKLTGDATLASSPSMDRFLSQPARYIESFTYEDRNKHLKINDEQGTRDRPHFLRVVANLPALEAELNAAGLSIKTMPRRPVVLILAATDARGRYVVGETGSKGYEMREVLWSAARKRGLTFLLPDETVDGAASFKMDAVEAKAQRVGIPPLYVRAEMKLTDSGYWDFQADAYSSGQAMLDASQGQGAGAIAALKGVTFDKALGQMTDNLLARMTNAQDIAVKRLPD